MGNYLSTQSLDTQPLEEYGVIHHGVPSILTRGSPFPLKICVRPQQQRQQNRQVEGLGEVDDQLELRWLLDRELSGIGALPMLLRCGSAKRSSAARSLNRIDHDDDLIAASRSPRSSQAYDQSEGPVRP